MEHHALRWKVLFADGRRELCLEAAAISCLYHYAGLCMILEHSERYVRKVFLRDMGLTPKLWLSRERMVRARHLLEGGSLPGEVAAALGFCEGSGFRKEFSATYGMSPGSLRAQAAARRGGGQGAEYGLDRGWEVLVIKDL